MKKMGKIYNTLKNTFPDKKRNIKPYQKIRA